MEAGEGQKMPAIDASDEKASTVEETRLCLNRQQSSHAEEHLLIERLRAGDAEAFAVLFRRYAARVSRQALNLLGNEAEAEEVVQEVFLTLYEKAHTFRGEAALSTWLYRLTANAALSRLRRRKRSPEVAMDDYLPQFQADGHHLVRPVVDWSQDVERHYATAELRRLLQQAIEVLQPLDKAVLVLSDFEELSNRDIGAILGLSVLAVKARLHRARLFLRGRLAVALGHSAS
jgi:RNA polymerase sigma-70 factor (ECF subfamily)